MKKFLLMLIVVLCLIMSGCFKKPYDKEELITIEPSQTAFLIPLNGDTKKNQANFDSMEFLESAKVPTKRVKIAHQWYRTGRKYFQGKWIRAEKLIIVERKPVTREWTSNSNTGTSKSDQGIETESKGSVGFIIGIGITAQIDERDAVKFLYRYNNKNLSNIMDDEIRNMVESKINEECSMRDLKTIMANKSLILKNVKNTTMPYFKERGITITNIGYKGQFTYSDPKIQEAINKEFIAEKNRIAQDKVNEMNVEKAKKEAEAQRIAQDERNAMEIAKAQAEAKAIKLRAETLESQIALKKLEIQEEWIRKWNGHMPTYMLGDNTSMLMNLPQ